MMKACTETIECDAALALLRRSNRNAQMLVRPHTLLLFEQPPKAKRSEHFAVECARAREIGYRQIDVI
jgi:hypothetical protein